MMRHHGQHGGDVGVHPLAVELHALGDGNPLGRAQFVEAGLVHADRECRHLCIQLAGHHGPNGGRIDPPTEKRAHRDITQEMRCDRLAQALVQRFFRLVLAQIQLGAEIRRPVAPRADGAIRGAQERVGRGQLVQPRDHRALVGHTPERQVMPKRVRIEGSSHRAAGEQRLDLRGEQEAFTVAKPE
jgi:hypothetical protein